MRTSLCTLVIAAGLLAPSAILAQSNDLPASVQSHLASMGYTDISGVRRTGDVYELKAMKAGQPTELRVHAVTGHVTDLSGGSAIVARDNMDAEYLSQQLEALGYTEVSDVSHSGNVYRVNAKKNGQPVALRIDGKTGAVTE